MPPNTQNVFLREVDEELRRDQLASVWTRYGRWIVVGVVLAFALLAGLLWWQHHRADQAAREGEALQGAFDKLAAGDYAGAGKPLGVLAQSPRDGYRAAARFAQADLLLQKNDLKGAARVFAGIAADTSLDAPFRDLATVRQASAEFDAVTPQATVARLKPLAVPGNPWFGSAGEMVAAAYLRMGRADLASTLFSQIARDRTVPETLRQRAVQMAGLSQSGSPAPKAANEKATAR